MKLDLATDQPSPAASDPTAEAVALLVSTDGLARRLDCSPSPIASALSAGRITPDALLVTGALSAPRPLFSLGRIEQLRAALTR